MGRSNCVFAFMRRLPALAAVLGLNFSLGGCDNSPNPKGSEKTNTMFIAFQERSPRRLSSASASPW